MVLPKKNPEKRNYCKSGQILAVFSPLDGGMVK